MKLSDYRHLVLVLAVLLPRMAWFAFIGGRLPAPCRDQSLYVDMAGRILEGEGLSFSREQGYLRYVKNPGDEVFGESWFTDPGYVFGVVPVETPTASVEPGYPLMLAGVFALTGPRAGGVFMLNCIFSLVGAFAMMGMVGKRWGRKQGFLAAVIWALYPYYVYYSAYAMTETVHFSMLPVILFLTMEAERKRWAGPAAGLATGFLFLVRSTAVVLVPLQVFWLLIRRKWSPALLVAAGFAVACVPWAARNASVLGSPILVPTKGSLNLWMRNNPEALELEGINVPDRISGNIHKRHLLEYPSMDSLRTELERDKVLKNRVLAFMAANPLLIGYLSVTRALRFLSPFGETVGGGFSVLVGLLVYFPMLVIGTVEAVRRRRDPGAMLPILVFLVYLAVHSMVHGGVRYRLPVDMVPILFTSLFAGRVAGWKESNGGGTVSGGME